MVQILSINNIDEQVVDQFQHLVDASGMVGASCRQNFEGVTAWTYVPRVIPSEEL